MNPIIEKYIGKEPFEETLEKLSGNSEFEEVFTSYLVNFLIDLEEVNDIEEDDTTLLNVPNDFIECYMKCRNDGFSKIWSTTRAELKISFDNRNAVFDCYEEVASVSKDEALKDLHVFCKTKNGDKFYTEFLIDYAVNNGYSERPIEDLAAAYSKTYKKLLENGKSELNTSKYCELLIEDGDNEIYCEDYALIYEQSINQGKSEEYAVQYAEKYASELVDVKRRAGISDDEEMLDFAKEKAKAYINGWEYATENNIKEKKVFIDCYSNSYLNTIYTDEWNSIEELEKVVLKKTLEKLEKNRK